MSGKPGLVAKVYEVPVLPNTVEELVQAMHDQKDLSFEDALDMARYLDERYKTSDEVEANPSRYGDVVIDTDQVWTLGS